MAYVYSYYYIYIYIYMYIGMSYLNKNLINIPQEMVGFDCIIEKRVNLGENAGPFGLQDSPRMAC